MKDQIQELTNQATQDQSTLARTALERQEELRQLREELQQIEAARAALRAQLTASTQSVDNLSAERAHQAQIIVSAGTELSGLQQQYADLNTENNRLNQQIQALQAKVAQSNRNSLGVHREDKQNWVSCAVSYNRMREREHLFKHSWRVQPTTSGPNYRGRDEPAIHPTQWGNKSDLCTAKLAEAAQTREGLEQRCAHLTTEIGDMHFPR